MAGSWPIKAKGSTVLLLVALGTLTLISVGGGLGGGGEHYTKAPRRKAGSIEETPPSEDLTSPVEDDTQAPAPTRRPRKQLLPTPTPGEPGLEHEPRKAEEQPRQQQLGDQNDGASNRPLLSFPARCADADPKYRQVQLLGNRPVGTYLCSYFPEAKRQRNPGGKDSCILNCPSGVSCTIKEKASQTELQTGNIIVNHHGPVPKKYHKWQIRMYYTGESNHSEPKKSTAAYWGSYDEVVSFHHTQRFHFTWTQRFKADFDKIALKQTRSKAFEINPTPQTWEKRIPAIAVFISRCGKGARDGFVRQLAKNYEVRSFGKCIRTHNAESIHPECPRGSKNDRYTQKMCVLSKYRYVLSMDNSREEDYVTEKVYHGLLSGGVALYDGAPNINQYIPTRDSVIHLKEFWPDLDNFRNPQSSEKEAWDKGFERLATYLKNVAPGGVAAAEGGQNNEAGGGDDAPIPIKDHFSWRYQPETWSAGFHAKKDHLEPTCDVCTLAATKKCLFDLDGVLDVDKEKI